MIITLRKGAKQKEIMVVTEKVKGLGYRPHISKGEDITIIGMIGDSAEKYKEVFEAMDVVEHVNEIQKPYKLASREFKRENTVVKVSRNVDIGGKKIHVMAGPCAIESRDLMNDTGKIVKEAGGTILRGGAFKPRSSPYAFQGLGEEGLKYMEEAGEKLHMPTISEAMTVEQVELLSKYCDIIQIGARNMQNYDLLKAAGRQKKPVLLKRGMAATVKELLLSAEYILSQGNYDVILCERGIRTFEDSTRFTMDLNAVPVLKKFSHLPVVLDPSHGIGIREHVGTMAKACIAVGADGIIIEVHPRPEEALSDGPQSLMPEQFRRLMEDLDLVAKAVGRELLD
ncbi:3-deoxy-7-phosphoheptulonate synthase [Candidatus Endomicrobiellum trichonymphae]|uniref:3-deoxy-7-phosphoheptulonate synthase n=2 Tax=Endomicrobium trichonymphae TaxID=1408204 RepID=A0A1E5IK59_ENDTX|nr:3-deoxy-7-phosphoheptulonate synthase [Candidatus Endomicrobium trichonymphae]